MLKSAFSKLKRVYSLSTAPRFVPKRPDTITVFRKVKKCTKSGTDKEKECEKCRALIELIFGPSKPTEAIKDNQKIEIPDSLLYQCQDLKKKDVSSTESPIVDLNSSVLKAKEDNILITDETNKIETEDGLRHATTAKQTEEQLTQKFEVIDKPYMVDAERPNIEGYNSPPKVLGNTAETKPSFNYEGRKFSNFTDTKDHQNKAGGSVETDRYDEIAKRCLDAPRSQIDERLLKKLGKLGVPQTSPREESVIEENIIQMDVLRKPRRPKPVEKTEIEYETREFQRDPPIAYIDNFHPAIQRTDSAKPITDIDTDIPSLKIERNQLYEIDKKPLMYSEEITAKKENKFLECEKNKDLTQPDPNYDFSQVIIDPYDKKNISHEKDEDEEYDPYWFNKFSFNHNQTVSATTANLSEIGPNKTESLNEPLNYETPKEESNKKSSYKAFDENDKISKCSSQSQSLSAYVGVPSHKLNKNDIISKSHLATPLRPNKEKQYKASIKLIIPEPPISPEIVTKRDGEAIDFTQPKSEIAAHEPLMIKTQYLTEFEKKSNIDNDAYESIQCSSPSNLVTNPESSKNINDVYTSYRISSETATKREGEPIDFTLPEAETPSHAQQTRKNNDADDSIQCSTPSNLVTNPESSKNINEAYTISSDTGIERGGERFDFTQSQAETPSHAQQTSKNNDADDSIQFSTPSNLVTNPESSKNINEAYTISSDTGIKRGDETIDFTQSQAETPSHAQQTSKNNDANEPIQCSTPSNLVTNPEPSKYINEAYTISSDTAIKREGEAIDFTQPTSETRETQYFTEFEKKTNIDIDTHETKQCLSQSNPVTNANSVTNAESSKNISEADLSFTQTETPNTFETQHVAANPKVDPILPTEQVSHSFMQPQTMVNPLASSETQAEPAKEVNNVVATCSLLREAQKELPLSELLKRVRMRSHIEFCQAYDRQLDPVEGKCGKKTPPCPPPAPKCPPPTPPPCPPAPPPCPKPCKPACPDPCPPPCPAKKSPCEKFKKVYSNYIFKNIKTMLSQPEVSFQRKAPVPGINSLLSLSFPTNEVVSKPIDLRFWMIVAPKKVSVSLGSNFDAETLTLARDFEPWVPIPSWPVPIKEKKRPFVCPKEGCKLIPPPRLNPPCKENPCINFPKRINSFTMANFLTCYIMSNFNEV